MTETNLRSTQIINKLTSLLMKNGKKKPVLKKVLLSLQCFYGSNEIYKQLCLLTLFFFKLKPLLETIKVRKGSKYYDVPYFIKQKRSLSIALRWAVKTIRAQKGPSLDKKIHSGLHEVFGGEGFAHKQAAILKKRVAANIMYSHFRWK